MLRTILPLLICSLAAPAAAQTFSGGAEGTPAEYAQRGMVLKTGQIRVDFAPRDFGLLYGGIGGRGGSVNARGVDIPGVHIARTDEFGKQAILRLTLGAAYGIMDDLEAGAVIMPIHIAPDGDFGDIELYGRYRFLTLDNAQIGAQLTVAIPTGTEFAIGTGLPVQLQLGVARIDTGVELELLFGGDVELDLDIPVAVSLDIADGFFAGVRSGFFAPDFDGLAIPLQGHVGYTLINGKSPFVDLVASFGWPRFIWTGAGDNLDLDTFDVLLGARVFFSVQ